MWSNTKLLITASFFIIFLGLGFLWFGLKPSTKQVSYPSSTPIASQRSSGEASSAARLSETGTVGQATQGLEGERAVVLDVVDGDTIKVSLQSQEKTVRFVGIDTPETVDPRRPVGCFGKEASSETKSLLIGKVVILQKDVSNIDKYNRLLRLVFLPLEDGQTLFINDYLVREGFAKVYTYPPDVKYNEQFRQAEKEARENKRGLWGKC